MRAAAWLVVLCLALATAATAGVPEPHILTAAQSHGHVLVTASFDDLLPAELVVATSPSRLATGAFPRARISLRETIRAERPPTGAVHIRARRVLAPGTYYVEVSGAEIGGVTDCQPHGPGCCEDWSNVRRVVIPRAT